MKKITLIDSTRASRDGHEFHEAWTARKALQLLLSTDHLIGIAVEGLHPVDQAAAASETVEIADIVLYHGMKPTFEEADNTQIIQFKYSISNSNDDFRAADAKKTIAKFAAAYLDHKKRYGATQVRNKLKFELITNRPIYTPLEQAITAIANLAPLSGEIKKQADQFTVACDLNGKSLIEFAASLHITGLAGNLSENKRDLSRTIVDWSAANDALSIARLGTLKQMVRDKAGHAGTNKNVITRVDVLAALDIAEVDDLLPCPASLPEVGKVVEREQLAEATTLVPSLNQPLLIHATGGIGKTVFLNSLAQSLSAKHEVILFDCFGGGSYRSPEDSRHLPKRGLVHIINTLACRGLCDPLLPGNDSVDSLIRTFRRRLSQCVKTFSTVSSERQLILFIDAIDNAAEHAADNNEPAFPTLLLESFHHGEFIPGVKLVVSSRSHRIGKAIKGTPYHGLELRPFTLSETEIYLRDRIQTVTHTEIQVAQARSGGNARILEHLVTSDRGLLDKSEIDQTIELDHLLTERIRQSLSVAVSRGYKQVDIDAFLAGLSVLPPPVPLDEYAGAHGFDISAIESFAADLAPLLERTNYGLMFRDEPTETLIRETYGSNNIALKRVAKNLLKRQNNSVYAARALPNLLQKLDEGNRLFSLAFDKRFPQSITSTVGKRKIRYARLKAAVLHAANKLDYNKLTHLLVELSTIAAVDQRGANYIMDYPDLVIAAQDVDATRRLFETRTAWPGTRHARLTIANTLSGDFDNAFRHATSADEWLFHYRQQDRSNNIDNAGPELLDIAAIPFCLIVQNRSKDAMNDTRRWKDWAIYEVGEYLFSLLKQTTSTDLKRNIDRFLDNASNDIGMTASVLSFLDLDDVRRSQLIRKLATAYKKPKKLEINDGIRRETNFLLQEGLLKASVIAISLNLHKEAQAICQFIPYDSPSLWSYRDTLFDQRVFQFLTHAALLSIIRGKELREQDILPQELIKISTSIKNVRDGDELKKKLKDRLGKLQLTQRGEPAEPGKSISYDLKQRAHDFIDGQLDPLLELVKAFSNSLRAPATKGDDAFLALVDAWAMAKNKGGGYNTQQYNRFFQMLGCKFAIFALWVCPYLSAKSVKKFLDRLHEQEILSTITLVKVVAILASRDNLHTLAGEEAIKTSSLIGNDYDVTSRATLFAKLARAILPASRDEATAYFKAGLEQMDAIGSGDYQFTNELLLFASSLKGDELPDKDFHTLTNICELNMPEDEEKFQWFNFAKALSRTSGCKTLARLARWDDRSKVGLDYTLLPYLTALIDDNKIEPDVALALNQLTNPVELHICNTATFANSIDQKNYPNREKLVGKLIQQFETNNPNLPSGSTLNSLASIAEKVFTKDSDTYRYLYAAQAHYDKVRDELNEQTNYRNTLDSKRLNEVKIEDNQNRQKFRKLAVTTNPIDEVSLTKAVNDLNNIQRGYDLQGEFFDNLRAKVSFSNRSQFIEIIARLENLNLYTKLRELKKCQDEWESSSAALSTIFESIGTLLIQLHSEDLVDFDQLSNYILDKIYDLSKVPKPTLALELIKVFGAPDASTPAAVWLGLASMMSTEADDGEGRDALIRLLNSDSAKLAANVIDGKWTAELYPTNNINEIASALVWRMLGSPYASDRWQATHSLRCFAEFGKWECIDAVVNKFTEENAHPFQAPELPFFYLHARLWLLIALARIALDDPKNISRYQKVLLKIALDDKSPHVIMKHFATQALLACITTGNLRISSDIEKKIKAINVSPYPQLQQKLQTGGHNSFYQGRPKGVRKPKDEFHLDYDFHKSYVAELGDVFGKPIWEISDLISDVVRRFDVNLKSMYESVGREVSQRESSGMSSKHHTYGQQLGWHALFIVAGKLLSEYPVTNDSYREEPWEEFLNNWLLTKRDGLWLSDGIERPPFTAKVNLLEKSADSLVLTGSKEKVLGLIGVNSKRINEITVQGSWHSPDNIEVSISSALVLSTRANALVKELIAEDPFLAWLPRYHQYEDEDASLRNTKKGFVPWIVSPSIESRLDGDDPLGSNYSVSRPEFADNIINSFLLKNDDPFRRKWTNSHNKAVAYSRAWGSKPRYSNETSYAGSLLTCSGDLLSEILTTLHANLLVLIKLQRYEESSYHVKQSRFSNTLSVLRIKTKSDFDFYMGAVNKVHESRF